MAHFSGKRCCGDIDDLKFFIEFFEKIAKKLGSKRVNVGIKPVVIKMVVLKHSVINTPYCMTLPLGWVQKCTIGCCGEISGGQFTEIVLFWHLFLGMGEKFWKAWETLAKLFERFFENFTCFGSFFGGSIRPEPIDSVTFYCSRHFNEANDDLFSTKTFNNFGKKIAVSTAPNLAFVSFPNFVRLAWKNVENTEVCETYHM